MNEPPCEMPLDLEAAIVAFVSYCNYWRYHKAMGNVKPSDGSREGGRRSYDAGRELQAQTITGQQGTKGAYRTSSRSLISRLSDCPILAGCHQSSLEMYAKAPP